MRIVALIAAIATTVVLGGCAHPISIAPNLASIDTKTSLPEKVKAKIAYYIPQESLNREVTTPGGGGDNVRYFPYRDAEVGYEKMLSNTFETVVKRTQPAGSNKVLDGDTNFLLEPELITISGSTGFFTWPPTNFSVDMTSRVRDLSGKLVGSPRVLGAASVEGIFDMKGNHGITGQNAMEDALQKMQASLVEFFRDLLNGGSPSASPTLRSGRNAVSQTEERLVGLRALLEKGLINTDEYEKKRKDILNDH